jgi:hypothetical protein
MNSTGYANAKTTRINSGVPRFKNSKWFIMKVFTKLLIPDKEIKFILKSCFPVQTDRHYNGNFLSTPL